MSARAAQSRRGRATRDKGSVGLDLKQIQNQECLKKIVAYLKAHPEQLMQVSFSLEQGIFEGRHSEKLATCWPPTYMYFH
eukprot:4189000-Prorocentrum_lima.AAC.1